jgi:transcriptional repressor NrdR
MQCPYCGSDKLKVLDTTDIKNGIRRRRECQSCSERFTTYERPLAVAPVLIKANGNREEFDIDKLKRGIWNACAKRPIPAAEIDRLAARVETYLQSLGRPEVSSQVVGDLVIAGLKELDPIAYIRYAIVYLGLDNLLSVRAEIDKLLAEQQEFSSGGSAASAAEPVRKSDSGAAYLDRSDPKAESEMSIKRSRRPRDAAEETAARSTVPKGLPVS